MKKMFLVLLILLVITGFAMAAAKDVHAYSAIKAGYGNETGGAGVGLELKNQYFGLTGGVGVFNDTMCWSIGVKGYFDINDRYSVYGGLDYGILGYEWASWDNEYKYIYAPYFMIGTVYVGKTGWYSDAAIGYGSSDTDYWGTLSLPTFQLSIGYAYN